MEYTAAFYRGDGQEEQGEHAFYCHPCGRSFRGGGHSHYVYGVLVADNQAQHAHCPSCGGMTEVEG